MSYEKIVVEHYQEQASELGLSPSSTMPDETVRKTELEVFEQVLRIVGKRFLYFRDWMRKRGTSLRIRKMGLCEC